MSVRYVSRGNRVEMIGRKCHALFRNIKVVCFSFVICYFLKFKDNNVCVFVCVCV